MNKILKKILEDPRIKDYIQKRKSLIQRKISFKKGMEQIIKYSSNPTKFKDWIKNNLK